MAYANIYNLTAFDADTKQQVFQWLNVLAKDYARPVARDTISHENQNWIVIGVLYESTAIEWKVDVKKANLE